MVGYAYSLDHSLGFGYILIKCYDCDDIAFADTSMTYTVYRVRRDDGKVETPLSSSGTHAKRLSLKHIKEITELLTISEFDLDYPVIITWQVTPSGVCNKIHARELDTAFPISVSLIGKESSYINITPVCFNKAPTLLDVTFLTWVLNEAAYLCGIFESEPFAVCGGEIFCSRHFSVGAKKLFEFDIFGETLANQTGERRPKCSFAKKSILSFASSLDFSSSDYSKGDIDAVTRIKRECTQKLIACVKSFLDDGISLNRMLKQIKLCVSRALCDIKLMSVEFLMRSGAASAADINYMTIDQLMMIFAFPISHTDTRRLIRTNKNRFHRYKTFDKPVCIYKGRLYYL